VLEYVRSRDALKELERNPGVRTAYSAPNGDVFSRFPRLFFGNRFEDLYAYYGKMVDARLDSESGMAIITAKAFTPRDAHQINEKLLDLSKGWLTGSTTGPNPRVLPRLKGRVEIATARAKAARVALAQYRNAEELIDPSKQAVGVIGKLLIQ
jgi:capsular polysaccharide transport system permease protein